MKGFIKSNIKDILLIMFLLLIFILTKYSLLEIKRHPEMFLHVGYMPVSFFDMLKSFIRRWPPGGDGVFYRPLILYIFPYIEFRLFQFNHYGWLVVGLAFSGLTIILCYIMTKVLTNSKITAFFTAFLYYSYYSKIHINSEANSFAVEYVYIVFYLLSLIYFIFFINREKKLYKILSILFFVLALMSKETSITLPVLLIVYLLIYRQEILRPFWNKIRKIKDGLLNILLPYIIITLMYLIWRVIVPLFTGNFNFQGGASGLELNFRYIIMNLVNIFLVTFQIQSRFNLFEDYSYSFDTSSDIRYLDILMLIIVIALILNHIISDRKKSKGILFGLSFYLINISIFIFFRAFVFCPHHILLSLIGFSIIISELVRSAIKIFPSYILYLLLIVPHLLYANNSTKKFINIFQKDKTVNLFQSIYNVLPRYEDRKHNTIIYIKNSKMILEEEGYDFFQMCILPSYKGKENVMMCHDSKMDYWIAKLNQCNPEDWNIIVLRYMDKYKIENITNSNTVKEVHRYMADYSSYYDKGEFIPFSSNPYVEWNMDSDSEDKILDSKGEHNAEPFNTEIIEGYSGKGRYFNGNDSYIKTPINFQGWEGVTISFWIKPEYINGEGLSVVLDNGHDATTNFVIQSNGSGGDKWVWHCNGNDIFLPLSVGRWNHIVVSADANKGLIQAYINGIKVGVVETDPFTFGPASLTIGRLALTGDRYFKGSIDEIKIWDKSI